uniref:UDENN domain-containing protein n=1 Tax=Coturnix japonica TaxID=93934 RepID=A0A8C2SQP0_COTJA
WAAPVPARRAEPITSWRYRCGSEGRRFPQDFTCIDRTTGGRPAELSNGSGADKTALIRGRDPPRPGVVVLDTTPYSRSANLGSGGPGSPRWFLCYRRAERGHNALGVTELCLVMPSKGESTPHTFSRVPRSLNCGTVRNGSGARNGGGGHRDGLLCRYPEQDAPSFPLPGSVPSFCLPMGAAIEGCAAGTRYPLPVFSTFVLTGASGDKVYGAAIQFHEPFPLSRLSERQRLRLGLLSVVERRPVPGRVVLGTKALCVLSHWPLFDVFRKFLMFLYRYSVSGPHVLPIETHIAHFMHNVPFPSPQRPRILVQMSPYDSLLLCQPVSSPLPLRWGPIMGSGLWGDP